MKRTFKRQGGKSVYRKALAAGTATIVTPAGTGMARPSSDPGMVFDGDPFEVPPKSAQWRLNTYRKQTGNQSSMGPDDVALMGVPRDRTRFLLGLTPAQRRRFDQKLNKAVGLLMPRGLS